MAEFQAFPITSQKTGLFNYLQPWIRPTDAFEPLENAQVYRGQLSKRNGYTQLGNQLADMNPVMGIMTYDNESTDTENLLVATTQNLYLYNDGANTFSPVTGVADSTFLQVDLNGGPLTVNVSTFFPHLTTSSVIIKAYDITAPTVVIDQITDNGVGGFGAATTGVVFAAGSTINYTTGAVSLNLQMYAGVVQLRVNATSVNYFTGNIKNFFNWTNWQPTDPNTTISSVSYLYMTNDVDPVTLYNGSTLSRPIFYTNSALTSWVTHTFDVKVYQNRLLFIKPTLNTISNSANQAIFWSAEFNPFDFVNDVEGHGGSLSAATADILTSFNFLRDICVVRFTKSVWVFRFTGYRFSPFIFSKINVSKRTNCPYASVQYDERETGIGASGITATDGVNVQRFDINIIDFYETEMSEQYYNQAFSQRYDNNSETWTLYVSQVNQNPLVGGIAPGSDKALVFNFVENSWATHVFSIPLTCLGQYNVVNGRTWASFSTSPQDLWESQDNPWFSYTNQKSAPNLLAGDTTGHVYWMDNELINTDNGTAILADVKSTRWNPFIQIGQKVQFGHIDFYYARNDDCTVNLNFYVDNSGAPNATRILTLDANGTDGNAGSDYAMKRIYINMIGEFLQMEIQSNSAAPFVFNGFILWARPAGRLTP